jgi:hypothetical protein
MGKQRHTADRRPLSDRFHDYCLTSGPNDCWPWIGKRDRRGYGLIVHLGKQRRAHRVAWMLANGREPSPDEVVRHKCDRPSCVNYLHLMIGSQRDNSHDCWSRGRGHMPSRRSDGSMPIRLTADVRIAIQRLLLAGSTHKEVANTIGCSVGSVSNVRNGKWSHM